MWNKALKKTIFTLNIDNYAPEIRDITRPLLERYAKKIGADIYDIEDRNFPGWPVTYEKLQIYKLAQQMENDWNIYIDSDALIHPETIDFTCHLPKDVVAHNGADMAALRWKYDRFFIRDGRNVSSCNWFTLASDLCIDLWRPLDDLTPDEAVANIMPRVDELAAGITAEHLIDDYTLSRNIARFGLKFVTLKKLLAEIGLPEYQFFWHKYTITIEEKVKGMKNCLGLWKV